MQKLYAQYADTVSTFLKNGQRRGHFQKGLNESTYLTDDTRKIKLFSDMDNDKMLFNSLRPFDAISGIKTNYHQKPGAHPDFVHIKTQNTTENHYITSLFIDIKRSTGLFRKYEPLAVANITSTIQKAALHTCWHFGGYIQRFHGDGLLVYFGGRTTTIQQSVRNALDAASFFSFFVKNDLKNLFLEQGVENIFTRIGIDSGKAEDVLWHLAGMGDCSEITTCSLHTSLAAHMQGNAQSNGIMVGDNVKDNCLLPSDLFSIKKDHDGKEDRYIFQIPEENFNYTQWQFNWENYLRKHPLVSMNNEENITFTSSAPAVIRSEGKNMEYLRKQAEGYKPYYNG